MVSSYFSARLVLHYRCVWVSVPTCAEGRYQLQNLCFWPSSVAGRYDEGTTQCAREGSTAPERSMMAPIVSSEVGTRYASSLLVSFPPGVKPVINTLHDSELAMRSAHNGKDGTFSLKSASFYKQTINATTAFRPSECIADS